MENRLEHNAPLIEVKYELQVPLAVFIPNLDTSSGTGLMGLIDEIIVDIYSMSDMIPRIAQPNDLDEDGNQYVATYESKQYTNTNTIFLMQLCIT